MQIQVIPSICSNKSASTIQHSWRQLDEPLPLSRNTVPAARLEVKERLPYMMTSPELPSHLPSGHHRTARCIESSMHALPSECPGIAILVFKRTVKSGAAFMAMPLLTPNTTVSFVPLTIEPISPSLIFLHQGAYEWPRFRTALQHKRVQNPNAL